MSDETKWRSDFPIEWGADHYVTRREFTKFLVLVSGAAFAGNGFFVLKQGLAKPTPYPTVTVARVDEVPVGRARLFRYPTPEVPAILIRLADNEWAAYLQRCTHLSCPVHWRPEHGRIECPCHNGAFDVRSGAVIEGPPPRALPRVRLAIVNGEVRATGVTAS